jgi:hypothetical protein
MKEIEIHILVLSSADLKICEKHKEITSLSLYFCDMDLYQEAKRFGFEATYLWPPNFYTSHKEQFECGDELIKKYVNKLKIISKFPYEYVSRFILKLLGGSNQIVAEIFRNIHVFENHDVQLIIEKSQLEVFNFDDSSGIVKILLKLQSERFYYIDENMVRLNSNQKIKVRNSYFPENRKKLKTIQGNKYNEILLTQGLHGDFWNKSNKYLQKDLVLVNGRLTNDHVTKSVHKNFSINISKIDVCQIALPEHIILLHVLGKNNHQLTIFLLPHIRSFCDFDLWCSMPFKKVFIMERNLIKGETEKFASNSNYFLDLELENVQEYNTLTHEDLEKENAERKILIIESASKCQNLPIIRNEFMHQVISSVLTTKYKIETDFNTDIQISFKYRQGWSAKKTGFYDKFATAITFFYPGSDILKKVAAGHKVAITYGYDTNSIIDVILSGCISIHVIDYEFKRYSKSKDEIGPVNDPIHYSLTVNVASLEFYLKQIFESESFYETVKLMQKNSVLKDFTIR